MYQIKLLCSTHQKAPKPPKIEGFRITPSFEGGRPTYQFMPSKSFKALKAPHWREFYAAMTLYRADLHRNHIESLVKCTGPSATALFNMLENLETA